jgi:hypothetical protein
MLPDGFTSFVVSDGVTPYTVTLTPGSYNYITLRTELLAQLALLPFGAWTITFAQNTSKYTFGNATADLRFIFDDNLNMSNTLGFYAGTSLFVAGSLTSERPINLQLTNVVVIETDLIKARQDSSINQRILHAIPDSAPINAPVTYQNSTPWETRQPMENVGQIFSIQLLDNNNRPLDPQQGCNITVLFYEDDNIADAAQRNTVKVETVRTPPATSSKPAGTD